MHRDHFSELSSVLMDTDIFLAAQANKLSSDSDVYIVKFRLAQTEI